MDRTVTTEGRGSFWRTMGCAAIVLAVLLGFVFRKSFEPGQVLFSNDGPLGVMKAQDNPAGAYSGYWQPLNWIGNQLPSALPTLTHGLFLLTGAVPFAKIYTPFTLFFLGLSAVALFYRLGFGTVVCVLGGVVAAFNTDYFSYACWGLGSLALCVAFTFFALAAMVTGRSWAWPMLAGLCVGLGIMEGYDSGAIMSLYVAAFVIFRYLREMRGQSTRGLTVGIARLVTVVVFAVFIAAQALTTLIGTQISGVQGMGQGAAAKEEHWDFATQWSLPKIETLRVIIPGLYGYRMDTPDGGGYWGTVGQQPGWETTHQGIVRFSGAGFYVGILVLLFAAYALFESFRRDSMLTDYQKAFVKFWAAAALLSLLYSFGRYAPFYRMVYALPYFSTIRNPVKFMHPFSLSIIILFGYGLQALLARSRARASLKVVGLSQKIGEWWKAGNSPERKWTWGCAVFTGLALLSFLIYTSSAREMTGYLQQVQMPPNETTQILQFSYKEVGWFLGFLVAGVAALVLFLSGYFTGTRLRFGLGLLGVLLITDMVRANTPWVVYYDYRDKYASNPLLDLLREQPYEHRATAKFSPFGGAYIVSAQDQMNSIFSAVCNEWLQHHFQFYRIQSLDIVQMPRVPEIDSTFLQAMQPHSQSQYYLLGRLWQLTNTRYLLGERAMLETLNSLMDPFGRRFTIVTNFDILPKTMGGTALRVEDFTAQLSPAGRYSLFEYKGAVPRAALFADFQVNPNGQSTLLTLTQTNFNPNTTVLVNTLGPFVAGTNGAAGTVTITSYKPKAVQISAEVKSPSVLVLFDHYDPQWKVTVDGKPENIVKADYIFRGVYLTPGTHQVEFTFRTPLGLLYVTLAAIVTAIGLCFYVGFRRVP